MRSPGLRSLNSVPAGLIVASVDFGPFIVANSHHNVVSAPYHRIDRAILAVHRLQHALPAEAAVDLRNMGARYVFECVPTPVDHSQTGDAKTSASRPGNEKSPRTFQEHMKAGSAFDFLEPVAITGAPAEMKLWRVKPR